MRIANTEASVFAVLDCLQKKSDERHPVSTGEISSQLAEKELPSNRKTIYKAIDLLRSYGFQIVYEKRKYYLAHPLSLSQVQLLTAMVQESPALTEEATAKFTEDLAALLSDHDRKRLIIQPASTYKTDNPEVLAMVAEILEAVQKGYGIRFTYFDMTIDRKRVYRRDGEPYACVPYAVIIHNGRCYAIGETKGSFRNYRIDRMAALQVISRPSEKQMFDLHRHLQASFDMYHGEARTVSFTFPVSFTNIFIEQFGNAESIIVSNASDTLLTVSVRTAVTPTLVGWILQNHEAVHVNSPASLQDRLAEIGRTLSDTYQRKGTV